MVKVVGAVLFALGLVALFLPRAYRYSGTDMPTWMIISGLVVAGALIWFGIWYRKRKDGGTQ